MKQVAFWQILPPPRRTGTYFGQIPRKQHKKNDFTGKHRYLHHPIFIFRDWPVEVQVSDLAVFLAISQEVKMGIKIKNLFWNSNWKKYICYQALSR